MNKERMRLAVKLGLGAVAKARKMRNPTDIKVIEATILKRPVRIAEKKSFTSRSANAVGSSIASSFSSSSLIWSRTAASILSVISGSLV
ncbi:hypothetical protein [Pseudoflavonifractor phocaeensis]|uniref:hypothetical protein n=1 Tax=Pseudoflavonifractor phocaeensis TaxID=1870988 RepID=UPI001957EDA8|nr:hypothetical protein [Pseudoflavonifractor phocaeensis]